MTDIKGAMSAFLAARYDDTLMILDGDFETPSFVLRGLAYMRKGEPEQAVRQGLMGYAVAENSDDHACAANLLAMAHARVGNLTQSQEWVNIAFALACSDEVSAERDYCAAFVAWIHDDLNGAESLLNGISSSDPNLNARSLHLAAYIAATRGDWEAHAKHAASSLAIRGQTDIFVRANMIGRLATLARETVDLVDIALVEDAFRDLPWTSYLAAMRFQASTNLAWYYAVNADFRRAYRYAQFALDCAPSDAWRVTAHIDHVQFALAAGEGNLAGVHAEDAISLIDQIDWESLKGEERFALLDVATILTRFDRDQAERVLALYDSLPPLSADLAITHDERIDAAWNYAHGIQHVAKRENQKQLESAFETYNRLGYRWRAAEAAVALARATGSKSWNETATNAIKAFPKSWLTRYLDQTATTRALYPSLTKTQREIVELLAIGLSNHEIAERLDIAQNTVKNHVATILSKTEAPSRKFFYRQAAS